MIKTIVTWDLGATKCAAAVVQLNTTTNEFHCKKTTSIRIRSCQSLADLSAQLEKALDIKFTHVDAICIGAAGQYDGQCLLLDKGNMDLTYPYPMTFAALADKENWPPFTVVHDYSPIICATFTPYANQGPNIKRLNRAAFNPYGRRVALGIGTGVGMKDGILFENGSFWLGTNEMGHIGITTPPSADPIYVERHRELLKFLRSERLLADDAPLTFEKILANQGMARIHSFFDNQAKEKTAEEIGSLVRNGQADETLAAFAWYLGLLVGTVQLSFMPDGGIWITGGVALNHMEIFSHHEFYAGIEASPAYLPLRQQFPLSVLTGEEHAFIGGAYYASKKLLPRDLQTTKKYTAPALSLLSCS